MDATGHGQGKTEYSGTPSPQALERAIAQMALGDQQALCSLYEQTKTAVYGLILSILKNTQDAEDVLQETYIQVFEHAASYRPEGKPLAWCFTIAKNLALMKLRAQKKAVFAPLEELECFAQKDPAASCEEAMVLSCALRVLSEEERQIVLLHAVSGFKHREIAQFLHLHLSTVLSKYYRAMKKLKTNLKEGDLL